MQAIGRNWATADSASMTVFPEGDAMVHLRWADGATINQSCDDEQQARETLQSLGFAECTI